MSFEEVSGALEFDGLGSWWNSMSALGIEVGSPMLIGALLTAPFGVLIAYPSTYFLVKWARTPPSGGSPAREESPDDRVDSAHPASQLPDGTVNSRMPTESARIQNL